jgi:hypothetical protein
MVVLPSPVCSGDGAECWTADEFAALVELDEGVVLGWLLTLESPWYSMRRTWPRDGGHTSWGR